MSTPDHATDVIIAGGGPTGLMLACELRLAGAEVLVLERFAARPPESKASGINARSVEILDQRGIADRFVSIGYPGPFAHFASLPLDISGLPTRYPYVLGIQQSALEPLLEQRAIELGAEIRRNIEVTDLTQDADGVDVKIAGAESLRARYLVGCDGGRSIVRQRAGIAFAGTGPTMSAMHADLVLDNPPADRIFGANGRREHGSFICAEIEPGIHRLMVFDFTGVAERDAPTTLDALRAAALKIAGTDFGMHSPRWIARFNDAARQAASYRHQRVLLAGDAAHIHFPAGGQGVNLGLQDAFNLGWKLGAVLRGDAPNALLDSYHAERHPVAERVLLNTRAQTALSRPDAQTEALRTTFAGVMAHADINRDLAGMVTQLDIRYAPDDAHPLLGARVPDADLALPAGPTRLFNLLHAGRFALLDLGLGDLAAVIAPWRDRLELIEARPIADNWALPSGTVAAPAALLIRPDGHVAWLAADARSADMTTLRTALTQWVGAAR